MGKEGAEKQKLSVPDTPERWERTAPPEVIAVQRRIQERIASASPRTAFVPQPLPSPPASESPSSGEPTHQKGDAAE